MIRFVNEDGLVVWEGDFNSFCAGIEEYDHIEVDGEDLNFLRSQYADTMGDLPDDDLDNINECGYLKRPIQDTEDMICDLLGLE